MHFLIQEKSLKIFLYIYIWEIKQKKEEKVWHFENVSWDLGN